MKKFLTLIAIVIAFLCGLFICKMLKDDGVDAPAQQITQQTSEVETDADVDAGAPDADVTAAAAASSFDLESALEDRILGDVNAPIKISEHSSFTCGHCGLFHQRSFKQVKAELIDTGKAYLVFTDFPLNAPALHASMIARCIPQTDRYFDFVQMLFEEQDNWAREGNYLNILKGMSEDYGLDANGFKSCLENDALQKGIVAGAKAAQTQWNVSSTPSFVVNNKAVISGAQSADDFVTRVNEAVAAMESGEYEAPAGEEYNPEDHIGHEHEELGKVPAATDAPTE